jgi:hypothetical protein
MCSCANGCVLLMLLHCDCLLECCYFGDVIVIESSFMFFCVKLIVEPYYFGHTVEGKFQISKFLFI